jgi:hypothetical protein
LPERRWAQCADSTAPSSTQYPKNQDLAAIEAIVHGNPSEHVGEDVSFTNKDFTLTDRFNLQARIESFNLTNTPNFSAPGSTLGTSTFVVITSTRTNSTPRQLQAALRLTF